MPKEKSEHEAPPTITTEDLETAKAEALAAGIAQGRDEAVKATDERLDALMAAFPERPGFVLQQFKAGATLDQAQVAIKDVLLAERDAEIQTLKAARDTKVQGVAAAPHSETPSAPQTFEAAIQARIQETKCTRAEAITWLAQNQPELANRAVTAPAVA